jgi:serine/threonine-protein kinase
MPGSPERVAAVSTGSGDVRTLLEGYGGARYVSSGHLVVRDVEAESLLAVAFDAETLEVRGTPVPVVHGVYMSPRTGAPHFAVSRTGVLVYVPGGSVGNTLVWVDRQGNVVEPLQGLGREAYSHPRLSPEGRRVAVDMFLRASRDVWVYDLARGTRTRLTSTGAGPNSGTPAWMPDGARVSFYANDQLYTRAADASTEPEPLLDESKPQRFPISWSPDGARLAFAETQPEGDRDIFVLPLGGEPQAFLSTSSNERSPMFSPDGRFIAYVSDESGRDEVYVRSYPAGDEKWSISTDGGTEPQWSPNGRELFYRNGYKMMAVSVDLGATLSAERPSLLFEAAYTVDGAGHPAYDVSNDGQRFLMIQESVAERTQINVVLNWFAELERLVPTKD